MPDAIEFFNVEKRFSKSAGRPAIADLSFTVAAGEHVCVVGRTGCGKSTAVNLILGLAQATRGQVRVLDVDPYRAFGQLRGRIGCVFQTDRLLPWRTALDNVLLPLEVLRERSPETEQQAVELLRKVGLGGYEHMHPAQLSGGMRQRVALARALITRPEVMIADEAFGALDEVTAAALRADFQRIAKAHGQTVLQITHSLDEALSMADRILVFDRPGRVAGEFARVQWQTPEQRQSVRHSLRGLIAGIHDAGAAAVREVA
ncbi:Bicarbonate transport ATP-binding protein CmpD [Pigmentiphaga humi]|uniref:Bicarbonate transport ATP-binding protein CmpD n=1 Tax=Pigmentiphaga humi TaxID=2478468 RepID=A0A3P4B6K1_9BURK|nr:ATP-binding cassette domain-containing protein [Pigmentiphaga humi]VCU71923.1 Bicarbonate transport ATP-binding protein CmpD [Pigmentiphaga humi]